MGSETCPEVDPKFSQLLTLWARITDEKDRDILLNVIRALAEKADRIRLERPPS